MIATFLSVISTLFGGKMAGNAERTFIMVKVDGVARGIIGEIMTRFEKRGFKLVAGKLTKVSEEHIKTHYEDLSSKPFYSKLCKFASSGPVFAMVWEGLAAVKTGRTMLGETDPLKSAPGTIRGDLCIHLGRNIVHGSDSVESANKEIGLWFKDEELVDWTLPSHSSIYE